MTLGLRGELTHTMMSGRVSDLYLNKFRLSFAGSVQAVVIIPAYLIGTISSILHNISGCKIYANIINNKKHATKLQIETDVKVGHPS